MFSVSIDGIKTTASVASNPFKIKKKSQNEPVGSNYCQFSANLFTESKFKQASNNGLERFPDKKQISQEKKNFQPPFMNRHHGTQQSANDELKKKRDPFWLRPRNGLGAL